LQSTELCRDIEWASESQIGTGQLCASLRENKEIQEAERQNVTMCILGANLVEKHKKSHLEASVNFLAPKKCSQR
jgi:hypothetical protein